MHTMSVVILPKLFQLSLQIAGIPEERMVKVFNTHREHTALDGDTPSEICGETIVRRANLNQFLWKSHCRGLYQLPVAA